MIREEFSVKTKESFIPSRLFFSTVSSNNHDSFKALLILLVLLLDYIINKYLLQKKKNPQATQIKRESSFSSTNLII